MRPIEKIRDDISYWEAQEQQGHEMVEAARSAIPGLRKTLEKLESMEVSRRSRALERDVDGEAKASESETKPESTADSGDMDGKRVPAVRLRGKAPEQVIQALGIKSPQSSQDLQAFLAENGRSYSRGAVDYALRDLAKDGQIEEAKKVGNVRFWKLAEPRD